MAQELIGGAVTASIWSGGSNGFIQRTDSSGAVVPLTDAQGSVIALTDAGGNLLTQYYYDPFGGTSTAGTASGNAFQYIGRENDPTGLYYMHARYYSPAVGRFISEDPLGFAGADVNLHAYTFGSPTNLRDPNGTNPLVAACAFGAATDVGLNLFADYYTGRKTRWQDAFSSATLRYAGEGCVSGLEGAMFSELVLAPIIDMAAPLVAKVFTSEAAAAATTALADEGAALFREGEIAGGGGPLPPTVDTLTSYGQQLGIDVARFNPTIASGPPGYLGMADSQGMVIFDQAFANEETLVKTMAEEYAHSVQLSGIVADTSYIGAFESVAKQYAETAWDAFLRGETIDF